MNQNLSYFRSSVFARSQLSSTSLVVPDAAPHTEGHRVPLRSVWPFAFTSCKPSSTLKPAQDAQDDEDVDDALEDEFSKLCLEDNINHHHQRGEANNHYCSHNHQDNDCGHHNLFGELNRGEESVSNEPRREDENGNNQEQHPREEENEEIEDLVFVDITNKSGELPDVISQATIRANWYPGIRRRPASVCLPVDPETVREVGGGLRRLSECFHNLRRSRRVVARNTNRTWSGSALIGYVLNVESRRVLNPTRRKFNGEQRQRSFSSNDADGVAFGQDEVDT